MHTGIGGLYPVIECPGFGQTCICHAITLYIATYSVTCTNNASIVHSD